VSPVVRLPGLAAVAAVLLVCLGAPPAPADDGAGAGSGAAPTSAAWHRLHPALCHTAGEHPRDY
jgi:hypothetical protein